MLSNLTVKIGADIAGLQKELGKVSSGMQTFQKSMMNVGTMIAGVFAVDKVLDFGKAVFDTTAKFQKFEAVLTNTLGDSSAAKFALNAITDFASKTPYQVDELTESFVKLANQGFIPTIRQMTSLGDLAASQGKTFNQLTEAIIDAQTGEFERLKEFGIRASKEGDKVSFTFKGVKQQVDFTSESIKAYILSLGQAEGVSGGMEAQSKTLGGGLSNLQDSFEQLKLAIGRAAEGGGLFSIVLDSIASGVKKLTSVFEGAGIKTQIDYLKSLKEQRADAARSGDIELWSKLNAVINAGTEEIRKYYEANIAGEKKLDEIRQKQRGQQGQIKTGSIEVGPLMRDGAIPTMSTGALSMDPAVLDRFTQGMAKLAATTKPLTEQVSGSFIEMGGHISGALTNIADSFGRAIVGSEDFGKAIIEQMASFAQQFGAMLIATGIGKIAFSKFSGPGMIAAGAALVALGGAVKSMIANRPSLGGGGNGNGSAPGMSPSEYYGSRQNIAVEVNGRVSGDSLRLVEEKTTYRRSRLG